MQEDVKKRIQSAALFAGASPSPVPGGVNRYKGKQFEYFEEPTSDYIWEISKYASNYYKAHVQGVIPGTFETERGAYIRTSDVVEQTTGNKLPNDYQTVYFQDTRIKGLYTGAKVKYAGNTWLAISPFNIADPLACAVIRRCNAIWRHYDYYGNIVTEPFVFQDSRAQSTANEYLDYTVQPNWYQKCVIQLNDNTRDILYNKRMVVGNSVVEVRGVVDFVTDFTGETEEETLNAEPPHALFFDVQFDQPTEIDDMEKGIADGKAFKWEILPSYASAMNAGGTQTITVSSRRNGEYVDTAEHPADYLFTSSDESVIRVDDNGIATAISEGNADITITLRQNTEIQTVIAMAVTGEELHPHFIFTPELPDRLKQMQTFTGRVSVEQDGVTIEADIQLTAYGDTENAEIALDAGTGAISITGYGPSDTPISLVFKDTMNNLTFTKKIQLEGY